MMYIAKTKNCHPEIDIVKSMTIQTPMENKFTDPSQPVQRKKQNILPLNMPGINGIYFTACTKKEAEYLAAEYARNKWNIRKEMTVKDIVARYIDMKRDVFSPTQYKNIQHA